MGLGLDFAADDRPAAGPRGDHRRVLLGAAQAGGAPPAAQARDQTTAYRWSRIIQRRPWASALVGVLVLVLLALPTLSLRLGFSDESNCAEETSTKQAYNLLVDGFGPGFNGPLLLTAELPEGTNLDDLDAIRDAVAEDPASNRCPTPGPTTPRTPRPSCGNCPPAARRTRPPPTS